MHRIEHRDEARADGDTSALSTRWLSRADAARNVEALLGRPHVPALSEAEGFREVYRRVADAVPLRGKLVPDALLDPVHCQRGARTLCIRDGDFRKFDFLDVRDPLS